MQIIPLYRITQPNGCTTVTPIKPDCAYTEAYRLVADEGRVIRKGDIETTCVDTDNPDAWEEIPSNDDLTAEEALAIILGGDST